MSILNILVLGVLFSNGVYAAQGGISHGGGDSYAEEFVAQALRVAEMMNANPEVKKWADPVKLRQKIESALVTSREKLYLDADQKQEVDAINYPSENRIEISRTRWDQERGMPARRAAIELHEYLGLLNIEENRYDVSVAIGKALGVDFSEAFLELPTTRPVSRVGIPVGYIQWPNGGGWVDPTAVIAPSAYIDAKSLVGSKIVVGENVVVQDSKLSADCSPLQPNKIADGGLILHSDLQDQWQIGSGTQISSSKLASGCSSLVSVGKGSIVRGSNLLQNVAVEDRSQVISSQMTNSVVEDGTSITGSNLNDSQIEDHSTISNSDLREGVRIQDNCVVKDSFLARSTIEDELIMVNSSLRDAQVGNQVLIRNSKLDGLQLSDNAVFDHVTH